MKRILAVGAVAATLACRGEPMDIEVTSRPEVTPMLQLAPGDTASVALDFGRAVARDRLAVTWALRDTSVARIEFVVPAEQRARVRAVGVGTAFVEFSATYDGQMVMGSVPVVVAAR